MPTQSPTVTHRPQGVGAGPALPLPQRRITTRCSPTSTAQSPAAAQRRTLRVQGPALPCPKGGSPQGAVPFQRPNLPPGPNPQAKAAAPALFPFVDFGPFSAEALGPRSARALPDTTCPLFRPFQHPPAGPSAPHPVRAWQIRLVSLCRLVRRASIPSCAGLFQAQAARKNAQHNSKQFRPIPTPTATPWEGCRACPKGRPSQGAVPLQRPSLRRGPTPARCGCRACPA